MSTTGDSRQAALAAIAQLKTMVEAQPASDERSRLLDEIDALARAVTAFHMEGIRFRSFNVERLLIKGGLPLPATAQETFSEIRRNLEAAGFHTRSHQSPV